MPSSATLRQAQQILYPLAYGLLVVLILVGIRRTVWPLPIYWNRDVAIELAKWAGACIAVALASRLVARRRAHLLFASALVAYLLIGVGLKPVAGAVLFLGSSYLCGRLLLKSAFADDAETMGLTRPLLVGLTCELALFGVLIHFPWNSGSRYLVLLAAPFAASIGDFRSNSFWSGLSQGLKRRAETLADLAPFWPFVLALMALGFAARFAFFPAVDFDNNAGHLRILAELTQRHRFPFDVLEQVWNVEPFALDLVRAIPSLVVGGDAGGAVALTLYALILRQLWCISEQLPLQNRDRLLLLALFASTPMTGWLITAMTAELLLAVLATAAVRIILECRTRTYRLDAVALFATAALCAATKLPGAVLGIFLLLTGALTLLQRRDRTQPWLEPRRQWPILLFLLPFAMTALNSYFTAWRVTGNPLFPLYNGLFKSPYFPSYNFADERWIQPLHLKTYILMFFKTSHYGETQDFVAGFQYLVLLPLGLLALFRRAPATISIAIVLPLAGFGFAMFSQTEYLRYLFPIAPLATLAIAALLFPGKVSSEGPSVRIAMALCIALNLFFYPGVSGIFSVSPERAFNDKGKAKVTAELNPVKAMVEELNKEGNRDAVLFPVDSPLGAALQADAVYVNWYAPSHLAAFAAIHSVSDAKAFLVRQRIRHVIVNKTLADDPSAPISFVRSYLDQSAVPVSDLGGLTRYDLFNAGPVYRPMIDVKQLTAVKSDQLDLTPAAAAQLQTPDGLALTEQPMTIAHAATNWAGLMRYSARFRCAQPGQFVAQINWDKGPPYYRLVPCSAQFKDYEETLPIPAGAMHATIFAAVRGTTGGAVTNIALETN